MLAPIAQNFDAHIAFPPLHLSRLTSYFPLPPLTRCHHHGSAGLLRRGAVVLPGSGNDLLRGETPRPKAGPVAEILRR
jgi:hypothetical protein